MLEGKKWIHVEVVKGGSVYPSKVGNQTMAFAFFYKVISNGKKIRKVVCGCSQEELEEKAVKFLDKMDNEYASDSLYAEFAGMMDDNEDDNVKKNALTFSEVGSLWINECMGRLDSLRNPIAYSTLECYEYSLKHINNVIGKVKIAEITQKMAEDMIDKCSVKSNGEYYSESHVKKIDIVFRSVINYGIENGYCSTDFKKIKYCPKLKKVDTDSRFLDREQLKIVLKAVEGNPRYKIFTVLLINTGLRMEEALALNIGDFKVRSDSLVEVTINKTVVKYAKSKYKIKNGTKTEGSTRVVVIPHKIYEMVKGYYDELISNEAQDETDIRVKNGLEGYIFLNQDKKPMNKNTFHRKYKDWITRHGGDKLDFEATLHMFRHSYASLMAEKHSVEEVAKILGDTVATVYANYYSLSKKSKENLVDSVSEIYDSITGSDF